MSLIGIDLGGTAIKAGRFDEHGNRTAILSVPTPRPATPESVLAALAEIVTRLDPGGEVYAIGVGVPGLVDAEGKVVLTTINLDGHWQNVPLAAWLSKQTGRLVVLGNDANLAGLGEVWLGVAARYSNVVFLTLGTGVGGALILGGKVFTGTHGLAGELGHMLLDPNGPACPCGSNGCLEQFVSAPAIRRRFGLEAAELGRRADQGDVLALHCWQQVGRDLGYALAGLVNLLNPEAIVVGGGVSPSSRYFFPATLEQIRKRAIVYSPDLQLLEATLGNEAGSIGAARLALMNSGRE